MASPFKKIVKTTNKSTKSTKRKPYRFDDFVGDILRSMSKDDVEDLIRKLSIGDPVKS